MSLKTQKILIFIASIIIIGFGIHFYLKFEKQEAVKQYGEIVTGEIVDIGRKPKGGSRTYKIRVGTTVDYLDWGPKEWDKLQVGDDVQVRFLKDNSEIIQLTMKPTNAKYFSLFWIFVGMGLSIISVLYKKPKSKIKLENLNWIEGKPINNKTIENYLRNLLIHPKTEFDNASLELIAERINNLYYSETKAMQVYLSKSLNQTDWKLNMIYKLLVRNEAFQRDYFQYELKRLLNKYSDSSIQFYEKLILIFMDSTFLEKEENLKKVHEILIKKLDKRQYLKIAKPAHNNVYTK